MVTTALGFTPANKAGDTFTGTFGRDANFHFSLNGSNPRITLDAGDFIEYDRATNKLYFYGGSTAVVSINLGNGDILTKGSIGAAQASV
jgi:hypothetical protein